MRSLAFITLAATALGYDAAAQAQAVTTAQENGYEVKRWQTTARAPLDSVGYKKTEHETREGVTPETDGNSKNFAMTLGGFVKKCPTAQGDVAGTFEYRLTVDEVITGDGETQRTHYGHRLAAKLEGHVGVDGKLVDVVIEGDFTREQSGAPTERKQLSRQSFRPGPSGEPDWEAMRRSVAMTGELAFANAILMAGGFYKHAELAWRKPNECVEFSFDPPSDTRSLGPNEAAQVHTTLKTMLDGSVVGDSTFQAKVLGSAGTVTPSQSKAPPDSPVTFTYSAPATRKPPIGFGVFAASRAGVAESAWRSTDALALTIEHRIVGRRDTPAARIGEAIFDGAVRLDVRLAPSPLGPGHFHGAATTMRQLTVGHITPRCSGTAIQNEEWYVSAIVDSKAETLHLEFEIAPLEGNGSWTCDGHSDELNVTVISEFPDQEPVTMSAKSGTRRQFSLTGSESQETLIVTLP